MFLPLVYISRLTNSFVVHTKSCKYRSTFTKSHFLCVIKSIYMNIRIFWDVMTHRLLLSVF
jgi:hypothetical protein